MNIGGLVKEISTRHGLSEAKAKAVVTDIFNVIAGTVELGEQVAIRHFGTFKLVARRERKARNPKTGAEIIIPARKVWKFLVPRVR